MLTQFEGRKDDKEEDFIKKMQDKVLAIYEKKEKYLAESERLEELRLNSKEEYEKEAGEFGRKHTSLLERNQKLNEELRVMSEIIEAFKGHPQVQEGNKKVFKNAS